MFFGPLFPGASTANDCIRERLTVTLTVISLLQTQILKYEANLVILYKKGKFKKGMGCFFFTTSSEQCFYKCVKCCLYDAQDTNIAIHILAAGFKLFH